MFQQTCRRLTGKLFGELTILSNYQHRFLIQEQLQEIGLISANIVLEPASRNTAAAACIAALLAGRTDPEALVLLAPSDHVIGDDASFAELVSHGISAARQGSLVTFGVQPDCPHTGYGYIETDVRERRSQLGASGEALCPRSPRARSHKPISIAVVFIGTPAFFCSSRRPCLGSSKPTRQRS